MSCLNQVSLIGRVGAQPEIRSTNSGELVANFRMAMTDTWKDKSSGERRERTEWATVVVWGGVVKVIENYVKKGSRIFVQGQLETREWTDKEGTQRKSQEVVVRMGGKVVLLDGKSEGGGGYSEPATQSADMDDEIPF